MHWSEQDVEVGSSRQVWIRFKLSLFIIVPSLCNLFFYFFYYWIAVEASFTVECLDTYSLCPDLSVVLAPVACPDLSVV